MKTANILTIVVLCLGILVCTAAPGRAAPVGTAFTYQGRLIDANSAAEGMYDLQFGLYDSNSGGSQVGDYVDVNDVDVIDGYFTVELDFNDANAFNGEARWLEIGVVPSDSNARSTILSPRQEVTPAPYAIYAANASNDGDWVISGDDMYSAVSGEVSIGTVPTGAGKLQVVTSSGTGVHGEVTGSLGSGVSGIASNTGNFIIYGGFFKSEGGQGCGVVGGATGISGKGVYGVATNPNDVTNYGGYFYAAGGTGRGVYSKTISSDGYAGYFEGGRNYFEGNVGIGVAEPNEKLEVDGTVIAEPVAGKWKSDSVETSWGNYQWDSQLINTNTDYFSYTSGSEAITILKEGYYSISAILTISGLDVGDTTYAQIKHNIDIIAWSYRFAGGSMEAHNLTVIDYFDVGDTVRCYEFGGNRYGSVDPLTVVSIHRLN